MMTNDDEQQAQKLREQIRAWTWEAVQYGNVDRGWANSWLARLGAETLGNSRSEYRINIPITGVYGRRITANSRADALEQFGTYLSQMLAKGKITADGSYDNVYRVTLPEGVELEQAEFYSGPEDPETGGPELDLQGLREQIPAMLREGVAAQGWGHTYANQALVAMKLPTLPNIVVKMVDVPVMATTTVQVRAFEGDDDEAVRAAAVAKVRQSPTTNVTVTEIGEPSASADF